jgi:thioredoxin-like negative regulator of GroEL
VLFDEYPENQDIIFQYINGLIVAGKYSKAQSILEKGKAQIVETRQYHFIKAYISHQLGDQNSFQRELASTQIEDHYDKLISDLLLRKQDYNSVFSTIFKHAELDDYKYTQLVKEDVEKFTYNYINKPQFKDSILVREEFRSVTEPIRLPASLEFLPSQ